MVEKIATKLANMVQEAQEIVNHHYNPGKAFNSIIHNPGKAFNSIIHNPGKAFNSIIHNPGKAFQSFTIQVKLFNHSQSR